MNSGLVTLQIAFGFDCHIAEFTLKELLRMNSFLVLVQYLRSSIILPALVALEFLLISGIELM